MFAMGGATDLPGGGIQCLLNHTQLHLHGLVTFERMLGSMLPLLPGSGTADAQPPSVHQPPYGTADAHSIVSMNVLDPVAESLACIEK